MDQSKDLLKISRRLRRATNPWEAKLWIHLRSHRFYGLKFKRQVPMGGYVVDFCCQEKKLIIELDGGHHVNPENAQLDRERQMYLESKGYQVLRFWNNDIDKNIEGVLEVIRKAIN